MQQIRKGLYVVILSSGIFFFGCVFVHTQMLAQQVKGSELICKFDLVFQTQMRAALVADDRNRLEEMFRLSTQRRAAFDKKLPE